MEGTTHAVRTATSVAAVIHSLFREISPRKSAYGIRVSTRGAASASYDCALPITASPSDAMSTLREIKSQILVEGEKLAINNEDVRLIRERLPVDEPMSADDLMVLAELRSEARAVCPAFDQIFFPAFKAHLLADEKIDLHEQFVLLRMLYGGGGIDPAERKFLMELRSEVSEMTPEFDALCQTALSAP